MKVKEMDAKDRMMAYYNALRGSMDLDRLLTGAMLVAETKAENKGKELSKEEAYEAMLLVADTLRESNPFRNPEEFYRAYMQMDDNPNWEQLLYNGLIYDRMGSIIVPDALLSVMKEQIKEDAQTVLIAEAEKFVPNLKRLVDENEGRQFTLTSMNSLYAKVMKRLFAGYKNVTVLNTSIYTYGFLNERFDLIISVPVFGGRDLAEDSANFICREYDMVAMENLLLHIAASGRLVIVMPARITFAGGRVNDLRKFVTQMYRLEEIAELPNGIFQNTGIKTFLIIVGDGRTEDVIVRRYDAIGRIGDWSIDKLLAQQDEEFMKYQASDKRKVPLGEVAEIFRGKSVTKKDINGMIGVVNISNIGQYEIDYDGLDKLNEEERKVQNYILREGDVLLPARGTAIRTAVFHEQSYPCIASSNVIVVRPNGKMMNSTYLKIFIDSPIGNGLISSLQQGITVMNISYKDLKLLEVPFPAIGEQEKVAKEYEESYQTYIKAISEAEERWKDVLNKLQIF